MKTPFSHSLVDPSFSSVWRTILFLTKKLELMALRPFETQVVVVGVSREGANRAIAEAEAEAEPVWVAEVEAVPIPVEAPVAGPQIPQSGVACRQSRPSFVQK